MVILWDNYIDDASFKASSQNTSKPLINISSPTLSGVFQFLGNSGNIIIDLGESKYITDFIAAGTNITDEYNTIKLEGNTSDDWEDPEYSIDLELYKNGYIGCKGVNNSFRYWRLVVEDLSISNLYIGYCYIGNRLQMPGIDPSITLSYNESTRRSLTVSRQLYADTGENFFSSSFNFPIITENPIIINGKEIAAREDILEMWGVNKGATPLILIIWDNNRNRVPPLVGYINENSFDFEFDDQQYTYSTSFKFEETK